MYKWLIGLILLVTITVVGIGQLFTPKVINDDSQSPQNSVEFTELASPNPRSQTTSPPTTWEWNGNIWISHGNPPACPTPLNLILPVDPARIESILYPGQNRGGDYKPHGGFRLNGSNSAQIRAPLDGSLVLGSRYIEDGETQYLLYFVNPCGIAYRFDHLLTLSPKIQSLADTLPQAIPNDSRTTRFSTPMSISQNEVIATAIGFTKSQNLFFDLGVYDLRHPNMASRDPTWASTHTLGKEQDFYGVCWLNMLDKEVQAIIKSRPPADASSGSQSDYCK